MFYINMTDNQVIEIDPGSDLYFFMVVDSGDTSDLYGAYHLLWLDMYLAFRKYEYI